MNKDVGIVLLGFRVILASRSFSSFVSAGSGLLGIVPSVPVCVALVSRVAHDGPRSGWVDDPRKL
jgi:hypothetical protein